MEITRGTHSLSHCGEQRELLNQKSSLKITRGQGNKRRGLEARMGATEKERESKKTKIQVGGSGSRERS